MSQLPLRFAIVVCFCLFLCSTAPAQRQSRWSLTGMSAGSAFWYLDKNFVRGKAGTVAAWEKVVLADDSFMIGLNEWDCRTRKKRLLQSDDYDPAGRVVNHQGTPLAWRFVIPDSIEEITFKIVCGGDPDSEAESGAAADEPSPPGAYARVTGKSAVLRDNGARGTIVRRLAVGEELLLVDEKPVGGWYPVFDLKTSSGGWLSGKDFRIVRTPATTNAKKPRGRKTRKPVGKRRRK